MNNNGNRFVADNKDDEQLEYLAQCAPLSRVFANHLFEYFVKTSSDVIHYRLPGEVWQVFIQKILQDRGQVFNLVKTHMRMHEEGIPTDAFVAALKEASLDHAVISAQTLSAWTKAGLVRKGFNRINHHSFAEVVLMRMLDKQRLKGWLPSSMPQNEPQMWVFYQAPPLLFVDDEWVEQPVQVVPYPLPADIELSPSGILWSPWEGLVCDGWLRVDGLGAIRFAGQISQYGRMFWQVSMDGLLRWNVPIPNMGFGTLAQSDEAVQITAQWLLFALAQRKFSEHGKNNAESLSGYEDHRATP